MAVHYTRNAINDLIYNVVTAIDPDATVASRREPVPNEGTAVYVRHRFNEMKRHLLLDGTNTAMLWTIDVSVYTDGVDSAESDAYRLADAVIAALKAEYFRLEYSEPIENADPSIYRLEMRFERIAGGDDYAVNINEPNGDTP